jgi:hypothetical protein
MPDRVARETRAKTKIVSKYINLTDAIPKIDVIIEFQAYSAK